MSSVTRRSAAILLLLSAPLFAADKNAGTSGAAFLKIGEGARPAAMGEAVTAVIDDVNAVAWNPAGLSKVTSPQFTAMHGQWIQGFSNDFVATAYPFSWGVLGLSFNSLTVDGIEARATDTDAPDGTFGSNDDAYTLSYGKSLGDAWSLGAGATLVRETLNGRSASAEAGNLGVQWKASAAPLYLGAALRNLGSKIKFDEEGDPLPAVVSVGAGYRLSSKFLISADVRRPQYDKMSYGGGLEFTQDLPWDMKAALRAGYNTAGTDVTSGTVGVTGGLGVTWHNWGFDMAWAPYGALGQTFRYALLVKF